jgi:hypothetical protein
MRRLSPAVKEKLIASERTVRLQLIDSRAFVARIAPSTGDAEFSVGALSLLWACSHLNVVYHGLLQEQDALGRRVEIDPEAHPDLKAAIGLVGWALNYSHADEDPGEWPAGFPRPEEGLDPNSPVFASTAMALGALAFVILHEIAHRTLDHDGGAKGNDSKEQEFEADHEAVELFLDGAESEPDSTLLSRQLDVVAAMLVLCLEPMFSGRWLSKNHPPAWERLDRVLRQMSPDPDGEVQMFGSQIKNLYSSISGKGSGGSFESPADSMEHFINSAAEETRDEPPPKGF